MVSSGCVWQRSIASAEKRPSILLLLSKKAKKSVTCYTAAPTQPRYRNIKKAVTRNIHFTKFLKDFHYFTLNFSLCLALRRKSKAATLYFSYVTAATIAKCLKLSKKGSILLSFGWNLPNAKRSLL